MFFLDSTLMHMLPQRQIPDWMSHRKIRAKFRYVKSAKFQEDTQTSLARTGSPWPEHDIQIPPHCGQKLLYVIKD